jgi:hypothetical protein
LFVTKAPISPRFGKKDQFTGNAMMSLPKMPDGQSESFPTNSYVKTAAKICIGFDLFFESNNGDSARLRRVSSINIHRLAEHCALSLALRWQLASLSSL